MKILYAIQGTGNGHLSRAMDVVPCLQKLAEVDVLVSGIQGDLPLPFPVQYRLRGLSFIFGKGGGVDLWKTFVQANVRKFVKEIKQIRVAQYDLIINDFEPVTAWACYLQNKPCISLSHQAAVLAPHMPKPEQKDRLGRLILKNYAPCTARYGFHFARYDEYIFTPVIRKQVREQLVRNDGHYTVYLPAYDDRHLIKELSAFKYVQWDVFSKHNKKPVSTRHIRIQPINNEKFIESMASAEGVLCGAGFETPAEALFMKKKLLVIPMKNQYEQQLNAEALKLMGVPVVSSLKAKYRRVIDEWLFDGKIIMVDYPDITQQIINEVVEKHYLFNNLAELPTWSNESWI